MSWRLGQRHPVGGISGIVGVRLLVRDKAPFAANRVLKYAMRKQENIRLVRPVFQRSINQDWRVIWRGFYRLPHARQLPENACGFKGVRV